MNVGDCEEGNDTGGSFDTIELSGDVTLNADLPTITRNLNINGNDHTIDGANAHRAITVRRGITVRLNDLTITKNQAPTNEAGGAILIRPDSGFASLTLNNVTVSHSRAWYSGSGGATAAGFHALPPL